MKKMILFVLLISPLFLKAQKLEYFIDGLEIVPNASYRFFPSMLEVKVVPPAGVDSAKVSSFQIMCTRGRRPICGWTSSFDDRIALNRMGGMLRWGDNVLVKVKKIVLYKGGRRKVISTSTFFRFELLNSQ